LVQAEHLGAAQRPRAVFDLGGREPARDNREQAIAAVRKSASSPHSACASGAATLTAAARSRFANVFSQAGWLR
jgi:hypothetical protein